MGTLATIVNRKGGRCDYNRIPRHERKTNMIINN